MITAGPGLAIMIAGGLLAGDQREPSAVFLIGVAVSVLGGIAFFGAQIYLLATRSQSIGKYFMKTQIVDVTTGRPADFVHSFLWRMLVNGLIYGVPCIGTIYMLVDICFVFREDRRCVHDLLASTRVVDLS